MRISILLGPFYPSPPAPTGAVQRRWCEVSRVFASRGHEVTIVSRSFEGLPARETVDGVEHRRLSGFDQSSSLKRDLLKDAWSSFRMIRALDPADVTVCNMFWAPWLLTHPKRKRHGAIAVNQARFPKGQLRLYDRVDRVLAVSQAIRDAVEEQRPSLLPKTRVIPNPINTQAFRPVERPRRDHSKAVVLYAGRVHPEKGLHLLIEAWKAVAERLPGAELRLMGAMSIDQGGGGDAYVDELRGLAGDMHVTFHEPVFDRGAFAAEMQKADLFVYPSMADKGESFGIAPLEAMATGLPTVVSSLACFRDFLRHGENGLVFDHHAEDASAQLSGHILSLLTDRAFYDRLASAATSDVARFSLESVADAYLSDFEELCHERG
jgi:glycosyltransferase involved in cell wall biosynthesis